MVGPGEIFLPDQGDNIIRTKDVQMDPNITGVAEEVYKGMIRHNDKIAQIDALTGETETFAAVLQRSVRVAINLKRIGVTPQDILTPYTDNHLNTSVIFNAIIFTGAKVASIDPSAPEDDKIQQLELVKPRMIFCGLNEVKSAADMIEKLKLNTQIIVFGQAKTYTSFDELLIPIHEEEEMFTPYTPTDAFEVVAIAFSSGTTGAPKPACIHNFMILSGIFTCPPFECMNTESSTILIYSSLVWTTTILTICYSQVSGNTRLVSSKFEVDKTWRDLEKYKVSDVILPVPLLLTLINAGRPSLLNITHLKRVMTGAAPISRENMLQVRRTFQKAFVMLCYGQTESGFAICSSTASEELERVISKAGSCGTPVSGCHIKIADPDTGRALGPNETGEVRIKSKRSIISYYKQESLDVFDSDGFLKTGDLMYYDADGYFFFVERLKDVLRYMMCSINPSHIEGILYEYPGVELAVVVGLPSDGGDVPLGVVIRSDQNITANELELFVSQRVDKRKALHGGIMFAERSYIPTTPSGKVRRRMLRAKIIQDREKQQ